MKKAIPTYDLSSISEHRFHVKRMDLRTLDSEEILMDKGIHRDSHYIFTCMESGHVKMMVDFNMIEAQQSTVFCVLPGQVHQGLLMKDVNGWFVAVKSDLIPEVVRSVFEESLEGIRPVTIDKDWVDKINNIAALLHAAYMDETLASKEGFLVTQSLLHTFVGMFAVLYSRENNSQTTHESRSLQLTRAFRIKVRKEYKTMKSPSEYAEILNVSRGYLTEVVRAVTGKPAQYWIHQEILIEAKRLLAFTHLTVKEIAYELGYNDHTYFSRLFSKLEDESPTEFRNQNKNKGN
ncbi:AraC family transcriptional regulator [Chryseobacterium lactis]|uniref:AraC family transcriptional regulator n=1 Tax=Chryseobacterium lactis TaxID=1241981 RepID=A0A3G6RSS9_CHRLC|nr:helix-turn-helix domain-containing protein [Chryseobacterium lactis]AZA84626.1 AraC family transcriptional regulator [Chryseobacterium lactis]AZB05014.1 AraC family transcriptional regulator [Chryseobacterium lactis]PNW14745.1 AraC family transcriptional regulator [Chryseobacterium lactis]